MVVELLRFVVKSGHRDTFVRRNDEVWTAALQKWRGFIRQQTLTNQANPDEVIIIIHWSSMEDWKSFPPDLQQQLESKMDNLIVHQEGYAYDVAAHCVLNA